MNEPHPPHYILFCTEGMDKGVADVYTGKGKGEYADYEYPVGQPYGDFPDIYSLSVFHVNPPFSFNFYPCYFFAVRVDNVDRACHARVK